MKLLATGAKKKLMNTMDPIRARMAFWVFRYFSPSPISRTAVFTVSLSAGGVCGQRISVSDTAEARKAAPTRKNSVWIGRAA